MDEPNSDIPLVKLPLRGSASDYPQIVRVEVDGQPVCDLEISISPGLLPPSSDDDYDAPVPGATSRDRITDA